MNFIPNEAAISWLDQMLGPNWDPALLALPKKGHHGTRKPMAERILNQGFVISDYRPDGSPKKRRFGAAVYLFVETPGHPLTSAQAAEIYAMTKRRWMDPAVLEVSFHKTEALDIDTWPLWNQLLLKLEDVLSRENADFPMDQVKSAALGLLRDALGIGAVHFKGDRLPTDGDQFNCLAVLKPTEETISGMVCTSHDI
jgi:hypothetical protein